MSSAKHSRSITSAAHRGPARDRAGACRPSRPPSLPARSGAHRPLPGTQARVALRRYLSGTRRAAPGSRPSLRVRPLMDLAQSVRVRPASSTARPVSAASCTEASQPVYLEASTSRDRARVGAGPAVWAARRPDVAALPAHAWSSSPSSRLELLSRD